MYILSAQEVNKDISKLSKAWIDPPTFVFLPERSGISKDWIEEAMACFPERFRTGHFALLTSGSTGQPKLVVGSRQRAENIICVIHELQKNEPAEETILVLSLTYCYAFVNQWLWARIFNRRFIQTPGFRNPDFLKEVFLNANNAMICLVGPQIPLFIRHFGENISFHGIIRLHFAGAPFPQTYIEKIHRIFPNAKVFNNYGCAEAIPRLTIRDKEDSDDPANIGWPLQGVRLKTDEEGMLFFNSPYAAVGCYDNSGFSTFSKDAWICSGDIGEMLKNGCWRIKGRRDEVFKRFGEKISIPQLLKTVYSCWSGEATFYKEKDSNAEEGHILVLSPKPSEKKYRDVLNAFRKNHPRTHWPIRLEGIDSLPLLENGKIDKFALGENKDKAIYWYQRA